MAAQFKVGDVVTYTRTARITDVWEAGRAHYAAEFEGGTPNHDNWLDERYLTPAPRYLFDVGDRVVLVENEMVCTVDERSTLKGENFYVIRISAHVALRFPESELRKASV